MKKVHTINITQPHSVTSLEKEFPRLYVAVSWLSSLHRKPMFVSSHYRDSPNHSNGRAIDLVPSFFLIGDDRFSVDKDPLLPNRIKYLQFVAKKLRTSPKGVGYFLETDHWHVQMLRDPMSDSFVARWPGPKSSYPDACVHSIAGRGEWVMPDDVANRVWPPFLGLDANGNILTRDQCLSVVQP